MKHGISNKLTLSNTAAQAPQSKNRILVLHTGGTFGLLLPLSEQLQSRVPEIFEIADLEIRVLFQQDSSNLQCTDWAALAAEIESAWSQFDAFIIIHGTDTLAYCASFFALTFTSVTKPIVITGSQRPLAELRSDARMNIIDSVQLAALGYAEVFVCFNSDVFLASRVSKVSNLDLGAFHSPNFPKLGHFGVEIVMNESLLKACAPQFQAPKPLPARDTRTDSQVMCLSIVPGFKVQKKLRQVLLESCSGLLFEGFGLGHTPTTHCGWVELAQEALEAKIPVVMTSQCRSGHVDMSLYEVGRELAQHGVLSAYDMTRECATVKLMLLLGRQIPFDERAEFMAFPLSREISIPQLAPTRVYDSMRSSHMAATEECK